VRKPAVSYDVFLCYTARDNVLAARVKRSLMDEGLSVFRLADQSLKGPWLQVREAIAESAVVVVLATPASVLSTNLAVEMGLVLGWQKPLYVVAHEVSPRNLPVFLGGAKLYTLDSLPRLISDIHRGKIDISDEERMWLRQWYAESGIPLDQLITRPVALERMTERFRERWDRDVAFEPLLRELFRLRKQGRLGPLRRRARVKTSRPA
jgi:hypothetical protein